MAGIPEYEYVKLLEINVQQDLLLLLQLQPSNIVQLGQSLTLKLVNIAYIRLDGPLPVPACNHYVVEVRGRGKVSDLV